MRRLMLPIFALALTLGACKTADTPAVSKGDDSAACATAKTTRNSVLSNLLTALLAVSDDSSSAADVTKAATDMKDAYAKLAEGMGKAADQAETANLKDGLKAYSAGAKSVLAKVEAAGTDRQKLDAATEMPDLDAAEKAVMATCA